MIYKLLGCGILLGCGVLYPRLCARERRAVREQIEALMELVNFMRRQIECFRLPVAEILGRCDDGLLLQFGGRKESLSALFEGTCWLDRDAEAVARELAASLGKGYYVEQLVLCDAALTSLSALYDKREKGEEGKRRAEGVLSLGAAALAVILLL